MSVVINKSTTSTIRKKGVEKNDELVSVKLQNEGKIELDH